MTNNVEYLGVYVYKAVSKTIKWTKRLLKANTRILVDITRQVRFP